MVGPGELPGRQAKYDCCLLPRKCSCLRFGAVFRKTAPKQTVKNVRPLPLIPSGGKGDHTPFLFFFLLHDNRTTKLVLRWWLLSVLGLFLEKQPQNAYDNSWSPLLPGNFSRRRGKVVKKRVPPVYKPFSPCYLTFFAYITVMARIILNVLLSLYATRWVFSRIFISPRMGKWCSSAKLCRSLPSMSTCSMASCSA